MPKLGETTPPGDSATPPMLVDVDGSRLGRELSLPPTRSPLRPSFSLSLGDGFFVRGSGRGRGTGSGSLGGIRSTGDKSSGTSPFSVIISSAVPRSSAWSPSGGESPPVHPPALSPTLSPFWALRRWLVQSSTENLHTHTHHEQRSRWLVEYLHTVYIVHTRIHVYTVYMYMVELSLTCTCTCIDVVTCTCICTVHVVYLLQCLFLLFLSLLLGSLSGSCSFAVLLVFLEEGGCPC